MAKSFIHDQVLINDGAGNLNPIQTGSWVSKAFNIEDRRRFSVTIGVGQATSGITSTGAGFTGTLLIQGTNEVGACNGTTGTPQAGAGTQPGTNGYTGALYWNAIQSGTIAITAGTVSLQLDYTDIGCAWVRLAFNNGSYSGNIATGTLGGSGTMNVFVTSKTT